MISVPAIFSRLFKNGIFSNVKLLLILLSVVLAALTFRNPTLELERPTYRYVFTFDISQSMNVKDVPKTEQSITRLEYAKQATLKTLVEMPCGTEAGLALFTGNRAFMLIKPIEVCRNHVELKAVVENINWRMTWKANSEIAKGLFKSIRLLTHLEADTRLVFITDGHESPPINPELPPRFPGKAGEIFGLIVGVGGDDLVQIPKFDRKTGEPDGFWKEDEVKHTDVYSETSAGENAITTGTEHLSSLKEEYLEGLATKTGLTYHRIEGQSDLTDQIKTRALSIPKIITTDMRWLFALGALLALITSILIDPIRIYLGKS